MKKIAAGIAAAALVVTVGGISVFAAGYGRQGSSCAWGSGCVYTDADNDGICDNAGTGCNYTDADDDGICDNRGTGCDNYADRNCPQDGTGNKYCKGRGCGR